MMPFTMNNPPKSTLFEEQVVPNGWNPKAELQKAKDMAKSLGLKLVRDEHTSELVFRAEGDGSEGLDIVFLPKPCEFGIGWQMRNAGGKFDDLTDHAQAKAQIIKAVEKNIAGGWKKKAAQVSELVDLAHKGNVVAMIELSKIRIFEED